MRMHWQTTCRTSWTPWVWRIFNLLITTRAFSGPVRAPRCLHSPVPTWGHRSQLRPQALPTVQQHMSWVRYLGSACSQPLDSDAIRKQWACSAGDSAKSHTKEEKHAKTTWWGAVTRQKAEKGGKPAEACNSPTHRFLSRTIPALQEHLKLPRVFRQSPFWQTPCMEHSLISLRFEKKWRVKLKKRYRTVKDDICSVGDTWEL